MKKYVVFLWIAALALLAAGCTAVPEPAPAEPPGPTAAAEVPVSGNSGSPAASPAETAAPGEETGPEGRLTVTVATEAEDTYAEDVQQLLLSFACETPSVTIAGRESAALAINAELDRERVRFVPGEAGIEGSIIGAGKEGILSWAREEYASRVEQGMPDSMIPYQLRRTVFVGRGDARILSFHFTDTSYTGGAHGYGFHWGAVFDTLTGQKLGLADLAEDPAAFLAAAGERLLEERGRGEYAMLGFYDGLETALPELLRDGNWYLDDQGLVVIANPYEIAPYASGVILFTLPYEWLQWHIRPEYLPETPVPGGDLEAERAEDGVSAFLLSDAEEGAPRIRFTARGTVENVSIQTVRWEENGKGDIAFAYNDHVLWYASRLENGESLDVRTWIPEILPRLAVVWTDGEGVTRRRFLAESGKDGSLVLMDPSPYADLPLEISDSLPFAYDIDGDGTPETVTLESYESGDGTFRWQLIVDGRIATGVLTTGYEDRPALWLADTDLDGVAELFCTCDVGSEDYVTVGWYGDTLQPMAFTGEDRGGRDPAEWTSSVNGRLTFSGWSPVVESWNYQLGTYRATRPYALTEDKVLAPVPGFSWTYGDNDQWLTLKRYCPADLDEVGHAVLAEGDRIRLLGCSGPEVRFVTERGETGTLSVELREEEDGYSVWTVDGIPEDELFVFLPYAG